MSKATLGKTKKSDKTAWIIVIVVGLLGGLLLIVWSTFVFGGVKGEEFSPDTFKRRDYSYYQIPLIRIQVTGIDYKDATGDLELHLKSSNLITVQNAANPRWHTIQATAGARELPVGDAAILYRYLDHATAPGGQTWLDWSTSKPNASKVLWPVVAQLARDQLYLYIPELLHMADQADNLAEFTSQVNAYAADSYTQVAQARASLKQPAEAAKLYQIALSYQADHAAALEGLAKAQAAAKTGQAGDSPK